MTLEFRNYITLIFVIGLFLVGGIIAYEPITDPQKTLEESQLFNVFLGAVIGSVSTIVAFLYKAKNNNGSE